MTNLEHALKYLKEFHWSVIPIKRGEKIPAISEWTTFQSRLPREEEVTTWWTNMPDANIAVICGISNIIVVDIDYGHGSDTNKPDISGLELPPTLTSNTGSGGKHLIYRSRSGLIGKKVGYRNLVDIQSQNAYIVLPPSIHPNGQPYEWLLGDDHPLSDAPRWLEDTTQPNNFKPKDWEKKTEEKIPIGQRNDRATQICGKILYEMSPDTWNTLGWMALNAWNKEKCQPPLSEYELLNVFNSVKSLHLRNNADKVAEQQRAANDTTLENEEKEILQCYIKNKTEGTFRLAQYIVKKYNIVTVGEREREIFVYQDGWYKPAEMNVIFPEVQRILQHHVTKNSKQETLHKIADMTSFSREIFSTAPLEFIPVRNGVLNFKTKELLPHSPEYRFRHQFPIVYYPEAVCPRTEAFFDQILTPEQRTLLEEWIGYYFVRNYMFKKALILVGEGDTGKTTMLEVITHMIGKDNISGISLQKMTGDKFSAAHLYGRHANIVDELSARDVSDTGAFKMATGGGSITGEYKYGNQFSFVNYSKFTFACNRIPDVSSDANDDAYFNRWMVIRFEKPIKNKIPNFIATVATEEERSGLFNLALKGLERLLAQGKFSYALTADETKLEMLRSGSSLAMFASEKLEAYEGHEMTKEDLYEAYTTFCKSNNLSAESKDFVGKRLTSYCAFMSDAVINSLNNKGKPTTIRGWRGGKLRVDEEKDPFDDFNLSTDNTCI